MQADTVCMFFLTTQTQRFNVGNVIYGNGEQLLVKFQTKSSKILYYLHSIVDTSYIVCIYYTIVDS